MTDEFKRL